MSVGAVLQQHQNAVQVAIICCCSMQRRLPVSLGELHVRAVLQQQPQARQPAVHGRNVQRRCVSVLLERYRTPAGSECHSAKDKRLRHSSAAP